MNNPVKFSVSFRDKHGRSLTRVYSSDFEVTDTRDSHLNEGNIMSRLHAELRREFRDGVDIYKVVEVRDKESKPHVWLTHQGWQAKLRMHNAIGSTPQEAIRKLNEFLAQQ